MDHTPSAAIVSLFLLIGGSATGCLPLGTDTDAVSASLVDGSLQLEIVADADTYRPGEVLQITAHVENQGDARVLMFDRGDPPRFSNANVHILDRERLQHFTEGMGTDGELALEPGERVTYRFSWDQESRLRGVGQVEPGFYTVTADLLLQGGVLDFPELLVELL